MPGCACWFKNVREKKGSFFEKQVFKWRPLWPGGGGPAGVYTTKTPAAILKSYAEPPQRLGALGGKKGAWDWGDL